MSLETSNKGLTLGQEGWAAPAAEQTVRLERDAAQQTKRWGTEIDKVVWGEKKET